MASEGDQGCDVPALTLTLMIIMIGEGVPGCDVPAHGVQDRDAGVRRQERLRVAQHVRREGG
jgi:hypothetical protein